MFSQAGKLEYLRQSGHLMATACHEAGHAVIALYLGYRIIEVAVTSAQTGYLLRAIDADRIREASERLLTTGRCPAHLLQYWIEGHWFLDAGYLAEEEFNLVPLDSLHAGAAGDRDAKFRLRPQDKTTPHYGYYRRNIMGHENVLTQVCRTILRIPINSERIRLIAELLIRTPRIEGHRLIDLLQSNMAAASRQQDLFWEPSEADFYKRRIPERSARQLCLPLGAAW